MLILSSRSVQVPSAELHFCAAFLLPCKQPFYFSSPPPRKPRGHKLQPFNWTLCSMHANTQHTSTSPSENTDISICFDSVTIHVVYFSHISFCLTEGVCVDSDRLQPAQPRWCQASPASSDWIKTQSIRSWQILGCSTHTHTHIHMLRVCIPKIYIQYLNIQKYKLRIQYSACISWVTNLFFLLNIVIEESVWHDNKDTGVRHFGALT